jgi:DNA-binding beta-propeller fold protein YncE
MGIAVNNTGFVYVVDNYNYRVQVFTPTGEYINQFGFDGSGDGLFDCPRSIAINSTGYVYVVDEDNYRIQIFTSTGDYVGHGVFEYSVSP